MAAVRAWYRCPACRHLHRSWSPRCVKCEAFGLERAVPGDGGAEEDPGSHLSVVPYPPPIDPGAAPEPDPDDFDDGTDPVPLTDIEIVPVQREKCGLAGLDEVMGGGLAVGGAYLFSGEPGAGKSTLTLQVANGLAMRTLYATGEESENQVAARAERLDVVSPRILLFREIQLERVLRKARKMKAELVVIDSIQTLICAEVASRAGSPTQVKECTNRLVQFAHETDIALWIIGHVTTDGDLAGPKTLSHLVDVVLWIEHLDGSRRRVRCLNKNRFGPGNVTADYEMTHQGFVEVKPEPTLGDDDDDDGDD